MTFLNMGAMSVASNCSIIYYTPKGGVFFLFKLEGCALKVGGVNPPRGSRNIPGWGGALGSFKAIQCLRNWYKSKAHIIYDLLLVFY